MWNKLWTQELFNVIWGTEITLSLPPPPVNLCTMSRSHQLQLNTESIKKSLKVSTRNQEQIRKSQDLWLPRCCLMDIWNELGDSQSRCQQMHQPQSMILSHFRRVGNIEVNHKGKAIHKKNLSFGTEIVECKKKYLKSEVHSLHRLPNINIIN